LKALGREGRRQRRELSIPDLELTSDAFDDGEPIPQRYTCDGDDLSPPLAWPVVPDEARSLALIVHDADAPSGDFVHWLAWAIDPASGRLDEGVPAPAQGTNGFGRLGYAGPCPPPGHGAHRYSHRLYALASELDLEPGAAREQLEEAMEGRVIAEAQLIGTYERPG
jgi:Raf kinase inhibitor-like YbhB/YbcL family protein